MRAYERLQNSEIIYNKRGIGYFIAPQALTQIQLLRRRQFINDTLPAIFKEMRLLGISISEIEAEYNNFLLNQI